MARKRTDDFVSRLYGDFRNNPSANRKSVYERMYIRVLTEIAANRFSWEGLPEEIDKRFLELELFRHALVVFFWDDEYDKYFALRGAGAGKWNMYDNPIDFRVIGNTMMNRTLKAGAGQISAPVDELSEDAKNMEGCVPIWGNTLRTPDWDIVMLQSTKLAEIETTIEITLQAMRKPVLFAVDDNEKQTFMNIWRQHKEGQPVIFGTETLSGAIGDKIQMFDLGVDKELVLNLQVAKSKIWNETMTLLGINNANQEKRERLVADEVSANDSQIMAVRNSAISARQYACDLINEKYGLKISVEWNDTAPMGDTTSFFDKDDPRNSANLGG